MKNIKICRLLLLILAMTTITKIGITQISKQQAITIILDSIVGNRANSTNVFISSDVVSGNYFAIDPYDSINAPYTNYWLGFIDEQPRFLWNHLCTYIFIDENSGNYYLNSQTSPPFGYLTPFDTINISVNLSVPPLDYTISYDSLQVDVNEHSYAVLFTGFGQNGDAPFWNHLSHMYCTLREKGFAEENIYVLSGNGKIDNSYWGNKSLDLDNDSDDDILSIPCSVHNLDSIFQSLETKMTDDDLLYVFATTHGDNDGDENKSYLILYQNEKLWDSTFAEMLSNIYCSQMIIPIYSCNSGGIVDDLSVETHDEKRTVFAPVSWNYFYVRNQHFIERYGMDVFPYFLITALRGYHPQTDAPWSRGYPIGENPGDTIPPLLDSTDFNPDFVINQGNGDSTIQIGEAIYYTKNFDQSFDTFGVIAYNNGFIKEDLLSLTGISGEVDTTQTLHGNYLIGGKLSVNHGVKLTLDTSTNFYVSGTNIIVKQDAVLSLDGGTITSTHDTTWQGIEVWGNTKAHQYIINDSCSQGQLILKNNATLENASNAVTLWEPDNWDSRGGIIIAKDSKFINNRRSVEFMSYQNHHPISGEETDYISSFTNCSFIYDDDYHASESMRDHVTMWGVRGVEFRGCSFINDISSDPNTGYGIYSLDAGYRIKDYCNAQILPCPDSCITPSAFKGFEYGIKSANVNKPLNHISVFNSDFTNNGYGIHLTSAYGSAIVNNNFELGAIYDTCNNMFGTGIQLDNSKIFAVENNHFKLFDNASNAYSLGIRTINTNNSQDEIYKNIFDGLDLGDLAEGKNWAGNKFHGLAYYCNQNQNNDCDFDVEKLNGQENDIQLFQGSNDYPAGNTFSVNATYHFLNNGDDTVTYYYKYGDAVQKPVSCYRVIPDSIQLTNTCPSHYSGGDDIRLSSSEYQQRETDYDAATSSYIAATANYNAANDQPTRDYWADKMSYYNTDKAEAAYDIIRSDLSDTIAHPDKFKTWMEKLNTYTSNEALTDYFLQQGEYSKALNKVDSLPSRFAFTAYDTIEYPMYKDLKYMQVNWLSEGRNIFDLTSSEISNLITIADSSKGTAGAQARAILQFAYPGQYAYINCISPPDHGTKSTKIVDNVPSKINSLAIVAKPNPANTTVTFSYTLPQKAETALLSIYNTNGSLVYKQLLNTKAREFCYNCSTLKPGVYYYSVSTTGETVSGKLIIVR